MKQALTKVVKKVKDSMSSTYVPQKNVAYGVAGGIGAGGAGGYLAGREKKAFWEGFDKKAYDYDYEAKQQHNYARGRHKDKPASWKKLLGYGGGIGAGIGGGLGALESIKGKRLSGGIKGALVGGAAGLLLGGVGGIADRADIDEQKNIMGMKPKDQKAYLKHKARKSESSEREYSTERRHRELMGKK